MHIEILSYIQDPAIKTQRLRDHEEIFFKTAKVPLNNETERQNLFNKYGAPYIQNWPDFVFFACDEKTGRTMGYLTGCADSIKADSILAPVQKSYGVYKDLYKKFPAHFHIDTHPDFQGQGVGTFLVQEFLVEMRDKKAKGAHIVTAVGDASISFYSKNQFNILVEREWNNMKLLFMGCQI